jgi:AraC-like DNA-binding protein
MGPRRYSLIKRIEHAMSLITEGNGHDLTRLALDLGFFDYSHFSHEFKRSAATTPREFLHSLQHREYQVVASTPQSMKG